MTIDLEFTPEIIDQLNYERYHYLVPMVQRRMEVLWLKSHNLPHAQIAKLGGVSENTMRDYFQLYKEGGIEKLKELNIYHQVGDLEIHIKSLEAHFRENPPATIKEAQSEIEAITGIKRSESRVREFLKKNSICVVAKSE